MLTCASSLSGILGNPVGPERPLDTGFVTASPLQIQITSLPPRHPDPDWTWCTPGIDLAWLGLAALTWFGPKLLAWPRQPAPRPPSAPREEEDTPPPPPSPPALPPLSPPPPPPHSFLQGQVTQCHPGELWGQELKDSGCSHAKCGRCPGWCQGGEERKVQPPYLASAIAPSAPPHARDSTPQC